MLVSRGLCGSEVLFFLREGDFLFFNFSLGGEKILSCKLWFVGRHVAACKSVFFEGGVLFWAKT